MKEKHREEFSAKVENVPIGRDNEDDDALAMVPPALLKVMDARMDTRIQAALEAERPQIKEAVAGAIKKVIDDARAAGLSISGVTGAPVKEGGVIPGSPVTSEGLQLIQLLRGGGDPMADLAKTLASARAISDILNPPSIWDRVMQNAVLRSLSKAGLVTEAEVKELTAPEKKT